MTTEPQTAPRPVHAIRNDIFEIVGKDYPLLGLLVDLEDAIEREAATRAGLRGLPTATCYRTHTQPDEGRGVFGAVWLADVERALAWSGEAAPVDGRDITDWLRLHRDVLQPDDPLHRLTCCAREEADDDR